MQPGNKATCSSLFQVLRGVTPCASPVWE